MKTWHLSAYKNLEGEKHIFVLIHKWTTSDTYEVVSLKKNKPKTLVEEKKTKKKMYTFRSTNQYNNVSFR